MEVGGRYTIYGKIASGGMASVHFGRQRGGEGFARTVAIKRLHPHLAEDPAFRATLIDEARMAARIHHPNVVPTLDVVSDDGELLVVMEYVRGESLSRLVRMGHEGEQRQVPLPLAVSIAVGALHGLHAAHEARSDRGEPLGIVHRDVSPQNILVGTDGLARVIDFGIAKAAGRLQITREGTIKGKRPYMAPEQITGGVVSIGADVYAMGVVLWEMLTARRLFPGENDAALAASVLAGAKEAPSAYVPGLGAGLDAAVMTALAVDPSDRFASALEMAQTLVALVPPAMTTEVGRWVEDSARDALAKRGAQLAEIESGSHAAAGALETEARGETSTILLGSQPSSISVETPRPQAARRVVNRRRLAALIAAGALLALASVLGGRGRVPPASIGVTAAIAPSVAIPSPQEPSSVAQPEPALDFAAPEATAILPAGACGRVFTGEHVAGAVIGRSLSASAGPFLQSRIELLRRHGLRQRRAASLPVRLQMTKRSARRRAGIVLAILARSVVAHADADREVQACIRASEDALVQRKAGKLLDARASLSTCAAPSCPAVVRASCAQRLAEVNQSIPSIAFLTKDGKGHDLAAVKLTVDDGGYVGYPGGAALSLDPGVHAFRFEVAGEAPLSTTFVLVEGDQNRRETIVFGTAAQNGRKQRAIGLTVGAVGLAGLAAGGVLGLMTISAHQSFEQNCGSNIGAPPSGCNSAGVNGQHDAATKGTLSTVAFIAGGAVLATGALLFFSAPRDPSSVQLGLSACGVVLRGRF